MNAGRTARRIAGFVVHNWPLKLAAIALATLLYAGFVASQGSSSVPGPITIEAQNRPTGTRITNTLQEVQSIRYLAPAGAQAPRTIDFRATIDLANVRPDGVPVNVPVRITPLNPDITILDVTPRSVQVVLEQSAEKDVPVRIERGPAPDGIDVGQEIFEPRLVRISGAASAVAQVVAAVVTVPLDPEGFDVDREIEARPVDANGELVTGVDVEPRTVHVEIPLLTNKESRSLPVNPVLTGSPAPGFRILSILVDPVAVTVEGDGDQMTSLFQVDTAPVAIFGATDDVEQTVGLALPAGIIAPGVESVTVRVVVEPITETRTYAAGLRLDGRDPTLDYGLSVDRVQLTLFGPVSELDKLSAAALFVGLNVGGLEPGSHDLAVVPILPAGVAPAEIAPATVTVTITTPAPAITAQPQAPSATPAASPFPSDGDAPSASP